PGRAAGRAPRVDSLACGTPVVSCRVGGVAEMAQPGDAAAFRASTLRLLADADLARRLRPECRRLVEREDTLDAEVRRHRDLYREVLAAA
ncbi:MAG TPA: hypothetical protein VNO23_10220, partial [Candidatus Binatia bacterium]|nr:hypothetical protein [Candidatus Binatia bacterium]